MPRTKSAERAARAAERKRISKQSIRSQVKRKLSGAKALVQESPTDAVEAVKTAVRALDKAVGQGIVHRNNAARRKSRLMKRLNAALDKTQAEAAPSKEDKPPKG